MKHKHTIREAASVSTPTAFFFLLSKADENKFDLISKLGCALLTVHNSSSNAERDISQMNAILANPRASLTSQLRLQA